MPSPFAPYANATLTVSAPGDSLTTDAKGNVVPVTETIAITAILSQKRPPEVAEQPGTDSTAVWVEGFAVEPMSLPSGVTPNSPITVTWNGLQGTLKLEYVGRSPYGVEAYTGDKIRGWVILKSFQAAS